MCILTVRAEVDSNDVGGGINCIIAREKCIMISNRRTDDSARAAVTQRIALSNMWNKLFELGMISVDVKSCLVKDRE